MVCTKFEVARPNSFGENVQKLTNDLFDPSDIFDLSDQELEDGHLKINRFLCLAMAMRCTMFEVDIGQIVLWKMSGSQIH